MTDKKITDLTAQTGANVATGDLLVTVDVSDTTMAATGTDKKLSADELKIALATTLGMVSIDKIFDAKGDLPVGTGADTAAKLAAGTNGQVLTAQSAQTTGLLWATISTSIATDTTWAAKGDLIAGTANDTAAVLSVGATAGDGLEVDSAQTTGLKWSSVFTRPQAVNAQTGTTYTLVAGDAGKLVTLSNAGAITLTLPQDSDATIAVGVYVDLLQLGAGQVTVAQGTGATLRTSGLTAKARAQYARLGVQKISANTWSLFGDLAAS